MGTEIEFKEYADSQGIDPADAGEVILTAVSGSGILHPSLTVETLRKMGLEPVHTVAEVRALFNSFINGRDPELVNIFAGWGSFNIESEHTDEATRQEDLENPENFAYLVRMELEDVLDWVPDR